MDKSINRRLDALQRFADENKPFKVKVLFTDGSEVTTDQSGALDLLQGRGPCGEIDSFQADDPMSGWAQMMTILLHPIEDRRLEDFE